MKNRVNIQCSRRCYSYENALSISLCQCSSFDVNPFFLCLWYRVIFNIFFWSIHAQYLRSSFTFHVILYGFSTIFCCYQRIFFLLSPQHSHRFTTVVTTLFSGMLSIAQTMITKVDVRLEKLYTAFFPLLVCSSYNIIKLYFLVIVHGVCQFYSKIRKICQSVDIIVNVPCNLSTTNGQERLRNRGKKSTIRIFWYH